MSRNNEQVRVKTWKVVVNNSGKSNMASVVGRYLTPEAAEKVAQAFRDAQYTDPYNYTTDSRWNRETKEMDVTTLAAVEVRVESDDFCNLMTMEGIRLAQKQGIAVRDEKGQIIPVED